MKPFLLVLFVIILIGSGCAERPPSTIGEIKNMQTDTPVSFDVPTPPKDPNDIYGSEAPQIKPRPASVEPLPGVLPPGELDGRKARIKTAKGEIVFAFLGRDAPIASSNFIYLARQGYYNGLTFHRFEPGFVIQGGDPKGDGTGGPGYKFPDEKVTKPYRAGTVAMANSGPNTNGSQFFIVLQNQPSLPPQYTIFGQVVSGMEVVGAIRKGDDMIEVSIE